MDDELKRKKMFYAGRTIMALGVFLFFFPVIKKICEIANFMYPIVFIYHFVPHFVLSMSFLLGLLAIVIGNMLAPIWVSRKSKMLIGSDQSKTSNPNEQIDNDVDGGQKNTSYTDPTYRNFFYAYLMALVCCSGMHLILFPMIPFYIAAFPVGLIKLFIPITGANAGDEIFSSMILGAAIYALYFYLAYAGVSRGSKTIFAAFALLLLLNVIGCRMMIAGLGNAN